MECITLETLRAGKIYVLRQVNTTLRANIWNPH